MPSDLAVAADAAICAIVECVAGKLYWSQLQGSSAFHGDQECTPQSLVKCGPYTVITVSTSAYSGCFCPTPIPSGRDTSLWPTVSLQKFHLDIRSKHHINTIYSVRYFMFKARHNLHAGSKQYCWKVHVISDCGIQIWWTMWVLTAIKSGKLCLNVNTILSNMDSVLVKG